METIVLDYNPRTASYEIGDLARELTTVEDTKVKSYASGRIILTFPARKEVRVEVEKPVERTIVRTVATVRDPTEEEIAAYVAKMTPPEPEEKPAPKSKKGK